MHTTLRAFLPAVVLSGASLLAQGDLLYTVTSIDNLLRVVDPLTATTISSLPIVTSTSVPAVQCNGMARDPISGQLYALVKLSGPARNLATIDPATGIATIIGPTGDNFAGLAFRVDGTLFGVTGDGATVPDTLYTINTTTAQSTFFRTLGNGTDGETIGFAPDLNLYHASGYGVPNVDEVFERIDTFGNSLTNVPLSGHDYDELLSLTSWVGGNMFGADINDDLIVITTAGHATAIGTLDHSFVKGMAFVPSPNTQPFFRPYGNGCTSSLSTIPLLVGSGTPTPSSSVQFHLLMAPTNSFAALVLGFGTGTLPIPSPACQVQISPTGPATVSFFSTGNGDYSLTAQLPASLQPMDAYLQMGILDVNQFVLTNPLQMHLR